MASIDDRSAPGSLAQNHDPSEKTEGRPTAAEAQTSQGSEKPASDEPDDNDEKKVLSEEPKEEKSDDKDKGPVGGYDATPIPYAKPGYTVKITMHRATSLAIADLNAMSSDPYVLAQINTDNKTRHKEDPNLRFRTFTVRKNTDPVWNEEWIVANVPASGFKLKLRVYDEDPADKDDRLGNVHIHVPALEGWEGIKEKPYSVLRRAISKRAFLLRVLTTCFRITKHMNGEIFISIEVLGRTKDDGQNGRLYTVGPCRWFHHFSPMLGRIAGIREPAKADRAQKQQQQENDANGEPKKETQRYNFQANQLQLEGPVPAKLYHRYVEFRPFVKRMFTGSGIQGAILGKALHHQHSRVYNFGRQTQYGQFPQGLCKDMTKKFLDLVHFDQGGRIFTYVLTLDALWRFTETGKEFGIDMLSKHTMHSDVSIYIAFSGEFFIRRLKHPHRPPPPDPIEDSSQSHPPAHDSNPSHPPDDIGQNSASDEPPRDPSYYELVIDNDSGTYRPNAALLPLLKEFMSRSLPGLHILTLDCQKDAERMGKMKDEQRERKKREGDNIVFTQGSDSSSISSSDEEELDRRARGDAESSGEHGAFGQAARDAKLRQQAKFRRAKQHYGGAPKDGEELPTAQDGDGGDAADGAVSSQQALKDSAKEDGVRDS
nr:hypothetical protein CFP56_04286 [Quercus suber]